MQIVMLLKRNCEASVMGLSQTPKKEKLDTDPVLDLEKKRKKEKKIISQTTSTQPCTYSSVLLAGEHKASVSMAVS